jgi:DNA-binding transcriptional LysR family regulator
MIELRSLRQFVAVAEELHFARAATKLHMTQPPLTQAIQKLEAALGAMLFERSSRSVRLSAAGAALLPVARRLLADAEGLPALTQAAALGSSGRVRLAFVSTVGYGDLPRCLRSFREAQPDIQLSLREATLDVQLRDFDAGEIDAGFIIHAPGAVPAGFEVLSIVREPMLLALCADEPLAAAPRLDRAQARQALQLPLVMFPREIAPSLFDAVLAHYRDSQVQPRIVQEAIQMQTIVNLVSAGMGAAWVPASVEGLQRVGVIYKPVPGAPICETSLIWRHDAAPAVRRFIQHARRQLGSA